MRHPHVAHFQLVAEFALSSFSGAFSETFVNLAGLWGELLSEIFPIDWRRWLCAFWSWTRSRRSQKITQTTVKVTSEPISAIIV